MHAGIAWGRSEGVQDLRKKGQFLCECMCCSSSLMRRLGRKLQLTDNHIHSEDTSILLVKHGQELFARGDFLMAFLTIMLPCK